MIKFMDLRAFMDADNKRFRRAMKEAISDMRENERAMDKLDREIQRANNSIGDSAEKRAKIEVAASKKVQQVQDDYARKSQDLAREIVATQSKLAAETTKIQEKAADARAKIQDRIDKLSSDKTSKQREVNDRILKEEANTTNKILEIKLKESFELVKIEERKNARLAELDRQRAETLRKNTQQRNDLTAKVRDEEGRENRFAQAKSRRDRVYSAVIAESDEAGFVNTPEYRRRLLQAKARFEQTFDEFVVNETKQLGSQLRRIQPSTINQRFDRLRDTATNSSSQDVARVSLKNNLEITKTQQRLDVFRQTINNTLSSSVSVIDSAITTLQSKQAGVREKDTQLLGNLREKALKLNLAHTKLIESETKAVDKAVEVFNDARQNIDRKINTLKDRVAKGLDDLELRRDIQGDYAGRNRRDQERERLRDIQQQSGFNALAAGNVARDIFQAGRGGADDARSILNELQNTNIDPSRYAEFTKVISARSLETGKNVKDLAVSFREVENVLGSGAQGLDVWSTSQKTAIATGADLASTAKTLTGIIKLYPNEFRNATEASNLLGQAARDSRLEFKDFSSVMGQTIGFGKQLGITAAEQAATLVIFADAQFSVAESGTQMRNVFQKLSNPTKETKKLVAELSKETGVNLDQALTRAGVRGNGFIEVLKKIREVANIKGVNAGDFAAQVFPNLRGTAGGILVTEQLEKLIDLTDKYNRVKSDSSYLEGAYNRQLATTAFQYDKAEQAQKQLTQQLAIGLAPTVRIVSGLMTVLSSTTAKLGEGTVTSLAGLALGTTALIGLGNGARFAYASFLLLPPPIRIAAIALGVLTVAYTALTGAQKNTNPDEVVEKMRKAADATQEHASRVTQLLTRLRDLEGQTKLNVFQENERKKVLDELRVLAPDSIRNIELQTTAYRRQEQILRELTGRTAELQKIQANRAVLDTDIKLRGARIKEENLNKDLSFFTAPRYRTNNIVGDELENLKRVPKLFELIQRYGFDAKDALKGIREELDLTRKEIAQLESERAYFADPKNRPKVAPNPGDTGGNTVSDLLNGLKTDTKTFDDGVDELYGKWYSAYEKYYVMTHGNNEQAEALFLNKVRESNLYGVNKREFKSKAEALPIESQLLGQISFFAKKIDDVKKQVGFHEFFLRLDTEAQNLLNSINTGNLSGNQDKVSKFLGKDHTAVYDKKQYRYTDVITDEMKSQLESAARVRDLAGELVDAWKEADKETEKAGNAFEKWIERTGNAQQKERDKAESFGYKLQTDIVLANEKQIEAAQRALEKHEQARERLAEHLTRVTGAYNSVGQSDRDAFSQTLGIDPKAPDPFGVMKRYIDNLYAIDVATKRLTETYGRLKSLQRQKREATGNPALDSVLDDIREKDKRQGYVSEVEGTFKNAISNGISAGLTSKKASEGLKQFGQSLKESVINALTDQVAKGAFDALKGSGIFGQLFGDTKYNAATQAAISSPEAFIAALRTTVLNVNVVNGGGGGIVPSLPGATPSGPNVTVPQKVDGGGKSLNQLNKYLGYAGTALAANQLLGNPLGRAGRYLSNQLFGKKNKNAPGQSRSVGDIVMNNVSISSPTDARAVASEVTRKAVVLGATGAV